MNDSFQDATLILVAHGSTVNAESCLPAYQHTAELRKRGLFLEVKEGFWKQEPAIGAIAKAALGERVFIVPLFISEGYFSSEVIPQELGFSAANDEGFVRALRRGTQRLFYCKPVGSHPSMTQLLVARADEVVRKFPFPCAPKADQTALFIAGHGTGNNKNSRRAIERQVELIRGMNRYAEVHAIFMEEEPRIADAYTLTDQRNLVVVPFFISDGLHSIEDIPVMLGEPERLVQSRHKSGQPTWRNPTEKKGRLVWYTPAIGNEPQMAEVILQLVREAAGSVDAPKEACAPAPSTPAEG